METQILEQPKVPLSAARPSTDGYVPELDGLRALAILLILLVHGADDAPRGLHTLSNSGWAGVDLFFVLSGFLITGGLLKTKASVNYFRSFYGRRFLRIFPVFYLALAVTFGVLPFFLASPPLPPAHDRIFYWLYLNNWAPLMKSLNTEYVGHFWSLAIEEQFYLIWPVIVLLLSRKRLAWVCVVGFVVAPVLRLALLVLGWNPEAIYRNTFCRMDALMIGALCALVFSDRRERIKKFAFPLLIAGAALWLLCIIVLGPSYVHGRVLVAGITVNAMAFGLIVLGCLCQSQWTAPLTAKPLRLIGVWSYGIYVYHLGFVHLAHMLPWLHPGPSRLIIEAATAICFAAVSFYAFERPILKFKHRFAPIY